MLFIRQVTDKAAVVIKITKSVKSITFELVIYNSEVASNYTSTQRFIIMLAYLLAQKPWVLLLNFDWFVPTFQPMI